MERETFLKKRDEKRWTEAENTKSGWEAQRSLDLMPCCSLMTPCWAMLCRGMLGLFIDKQASQLQQWRIMNSIQDMRNVQKMTMVSGFISSQDKTRCILLCPRYSEGQPGNRYYGGNEVIDKAAQCGRQMKRRKQIRIKWIKWNQKCNQVIKLL